MSLKDLFKEKVSATKFSNKSLDIIADEVESADYLKRFVEDRERFVPPVDFSLPENFVFFGSAERYYEDSIRRIYQQYPYDGSRKEKIEWHLTSSYFDNYFLENEYPRTNGYALLSADGWGAPVVAVGDYGATATASYEYIQTKGGPNRDPARSKLTEIYPSEGGTANVYDPSENRETNFKFDLKKNGATVEFWLKKDAFGINNTKKEVIFDLWNGEPSSSSEYGRLTVEISGTTASESPFYVTAQSGTAGFFNQQIGSSIAGTGSLTTWKHYAFTFVSASSGVDTKFYVNGDLNQEISLGSEGIDEVTGSLISNIGALRSSPSGSIFDGIAMEGWGKLSGSIDEFRFWKAKRDSRQVGRYWFTQVGAGTNTDTANTTLGVYYKFNEGISGINRLDSAVLDYSGRVSNGVWLGYGTSSRSTQSAMVNSSAAPVEFKDPIVYTQHPDVISLRQTKRLEGRDYDSRNNSSLINSYPGWILDEDDDAELAKLTQVISSYFDTLYLQIQAVSDLKNPTYLSSSVSGTWKPLPFSEKLLASSGLVVSNLFVNTEIIEEFLSRDEDRDYTFKLDETKNLIFQNIYNNLTYIYKTKGTEKSFRNLIRCFGVDDELIKLNLYADGITYPLTDNYRESSYRNSYADFVRPSRFESTIHQYANTSNPNTVSFISGSGLQGLESGSAFTVEAEIKFPAKPPQGSHWFETPFSQSSLFGMHTADPTAPLNDLTVPAADPSNFQVYSVRNNNDSSNTRFVLTGSAGGYVPNLTSSIFLNAYDDERWIVAVRIKPSKYPLVGAVAGTENDGYEVNFYGANATFGAVVNEFEVSGTITRNQGMEILSNPRRIFGGAHRQNFTGSVLNRSDTRVGSIRVWQDFISNDALRAHAIDPASIGTLNPSRRAYLFEDSLGKLDTSQIESLILQWTFETITGSNAAGEFTIPDVSSGSITDNQFAGLSNIVNRQHSGRGFGFPANSTSSIDKDYDFAYVHQIPEILTNQDTVKVLTRDDEVFTRESRPINYFYSIEKSMYQEISGDILKWFATIRDFNNLIGEPVNRYRQEYKSLAKLRQVYFDRVQGAPDFERFTNFYKWIDSSLNEMIFQLIPASANSSEEIQNLIESHILERNKYWNKFPTLEAESTDPESGLRGINELLYDWKTGHAPISNRQNQNCFWWKERAEREGIISSGDANVNLDRGQILDATLKVLNRKFSTPHRLGLDRTLNLGGGINLPVNKRPDISMVNLQPFAVEPITITLGPVPDCTDGLNSPTRYGKKIKIPLLAKGRLSPDAISGDSIAPFSVFSSSAGNTQLSIATNKELTNLHSDGYGDLKEVPLQGPFTEKYVGGRSYRHAALTKPIITPARTAAENIADANYLHPMSTGDRDPVTTTDTFPDGSPWTSTHWAQATLGVPAHQSLIDGSKLAGIWCSGYTYGFTTNWYFGIPLGPSFWWIEFPEPILITSARGNGHQRRGDGGVWQFQGSNDGVSYTDIGTSWLFEDIFGPPDPATTGPGNSGTWSQFSANTTEYKYLKCLCVGNPTDYDASGFEDVYFWEMEFNIASATPEITRMPTEADREEGFRLKIAPDATSANYTEPLSSGNRTSEVDVTIGGAGSWTDSGGTANYDWIVDGNHFGNGLRVNDTSYATGFFQFDFGSPILITEVYGTGDWSPASTSDGGTWKWQGSANASAWTDIGSTFTISGTMACPTCTEPIAGFRQWYDTELSGNTTAYRYYRMLGVSGPVNSAPGGTTVTWWEMDFKVASPRNVVSVMQPEKGADGNINLNLPTARYFRDETAKRPLNIRNILQTTGSTIIGNYDELYQVVQTSNRRTNNQWWVDNKTAGIEYDNNSFSLVSSIPTPYAISGAIGWYEYGLPQRGKTPHVIVERFSSLGAPETAGDSNGGLGLDVLSAEYSLYNTMNYRNTSVRQPLDAWSVEHAAWGGLDPDSSLTAAFPQAAFHKTNRNALKRIELSGTTPVTASVYDNLFVQHPIPQSDLGYAWIRASAIISPFGFSTDAGKLVTDSEAITFLSASEHAVFEDLGLRFFGSSKYYTSVVDPSFFTDFVGLNYNIYEPADSSNNTLGYSTVEYTDLQAGTQPALSLAYPPTVRGSLNYINQYFVDGIGAVWPATGPETYAHVPQKSLYAAGYFEMLASEIVQGDFLKINDGTTIYVFYWDNLATPFAPPEYGVPFNTLDAPGSAANMWGAIMASGINITAYKDATVTTVKISLEHNTLGTIGNELLQYGLGAPASLVLTGMAGGNLGNPNIVGVEAMLNAINLNRNGPYGYPMWKQIRTGEHPIARQQRRINKLDYIKPAEPDTRRTITINGRTITRTFPRWQRLKTVTEPVVTSRYKPLKSNLNMDVGEGENKNFALKHTYGNNLSYFTHEELNNYLEWPRLGSERGLVLQSVPKQVYDDIVNLYTNPNIPENSNPIKDFVSLVYSETIYPRSTNAFLDRTRDRVNYDVGAILGWRRSNAARVGGLKALPPSFAPHPPATTPNSQGNLFPLYTSSMWPLDGRLVYRENCFTVKCTRPSIFGQDPSFNFVSATILSIAGAPVPPVPELLDGGYDGSGELLNDYVQFHNGNINNVKPGAMYARRNREFMSASLQYDEINPSGSACSVVTGDALWEAPAQAGKNPFYDTYDDFADEIKRMGKDFSIIPEFNISDHIGYFVDQGDFFGDLPNDLFSLDGGAVSGLADRSQINNKTFFNLYNTSDFLKHFQVINSDHSDEDFRKELTLSCEAIMKFRPRDGFYPAQRTLQLATLLSQSFSAGVTLTGAEPNFRTFLAPFYAPGIMYNTIKSGIAVDYPIMTASFDQEIRLNALFGGGGVGPGAASDIAFVSTFPIAGASASWNYQVDMWKKEWDASYPAPDGNDARERRSAIKQNYDRRIPFEAILNPLAGSVSSQIKVLDVELHLSSTMDSTASFDGTPSPKYELAAHNFFAESAEFFLPTREIGTFTSFLSNKKDTQVNPIPGGKYKMEVVLTNQLAGTVPGGGSFATLFPAFGTGCFTSSIDMYNRAIYGARDWPGKDTTVANHDLAFGPPSVEWLSPAGVGAPPSPIAFLFLSSAPYTPPYYDGPAKVTFEFNARRLSNGERWSIEKIVEELTSSFDRAGILNVLEPWAYGSAMQVSSSINLTSIIKNRVVETDSQGTIISLRDAEPGAGIRNSVWAIEPKFETPILDFRDAEVTLPISGAYSTPRGMWHQYGKIPDAVQKGIFLQINDVSSSVAVESLADLVGFEKVAKRLGEVGTAKTVSEAIVAIPILRGTSNNPDEVSFIPLHTPNGPAGVTGKEIIADAKEAIKLGLRTGVRHTEATREVLKVVKQLQKYILPPKWDFVANPDEAADPFILYLFEFGHTFDQQDLVDMWQNLPPDERKIARNNVSRTTATSPTLRAELQKRGKTIGDLEWIVFKVKQRASINYFEKTLASKDDDDFKVSIGQNPEAVPQYSYNWPYDYFSLVELVKMDAEVKIMKHPEPDEPTIEEILEGEGVVDEGAL